MLSVSWMTLSEWLFSMDHPNLLRRIRSIFFVSQGLDNCICCFCIMLLVSLIIRHLVCRVCCFPIRRMPEGDSRHLSACFEIPCWEIGIALPHLLNKQHLSFESCASMKQRTGYKCACAFHSWAYGLNDTVSWEKIPHIRHEQPAIRKDWLPRLKDNRRCDLGQYPCQRKKKKKRVYCSIRDLYIPGGIGKIC